MAVDRSSREWMQALARVRTKAARLRHTARPECSDIVEALDETLELTDAIRAKCAELQRCNLRLEAEVHRSVEETRALLDTLPQPIIHTDCAGLIVESNRAAASLLGLSQARLKNELLLHFTQDRAAFTALIRELPRDGAPARASVRIRPRDRAPFDAICTILHDPRSGDPRWLWLIERFSAAQTPARIPPRAADARLRSDLCET